MIATGPLGVGDGAGVALAEADAGACAVGDAAVLATGDELTTGATDGTAEAGALLGAALAAMATVDAPGKSSFT